MPQALIGTTKHALDTPVLCLDVEQFSRNVKHLAAVAAAGGKAWRPHAKGHKCPTIAHQELAAGASGVTCAKLGEAEAFAVAGVPNILIANVVFGPRKMERLAGLAHWADVTVCCDHFIQAEQMAAAARRAGSTIKVLIDINIGMNRTGIRPGKDTMELAEAISRLPGLRLCGIMGYEGHLLRVSDPEEKRQRIQEAISILAHHREQFLQRGFCCDVVSAGGTGSIQITAQCPGVTELQAGGGVFGDPFYAQAMGLEGCQPAITVLATVVSRPALNRAVLDAGRKATNPDFQLPTIQGYPDAVVASMSAEHCTLELGAESQKLQIGDQVELVVGYCDFTTPLHDDFYVFRGSRLEALWPITGRGRLQ